MSKIAVAFHAVAFFESFISLSTYYYYADAYRPPSYGGQWKYLSFINLHLKLLYFVLCLIVNLFQALHLQSSAAAIKRFKDIFYASICLPCCLAVFMSFWVVYFINRELVHPAYLDNILPQWANHFFHTFVLIIILEIYFERLEYPSRKAGFFFSALFELLYLAWVLWVKNRSGIWVYAFLKRLKGPSFAAVVIAEILFAWSSYLLGEWLSNKFATQVIKKVQ